MSNLVGQQVNVQQRRVMSNLVGRQVIARNEHITRLYQN